MSYKILRITNLYSEYIESYYSKNTQYSTQNYQEQYQHITNDSIELVNSYSKFFRQIGVDAIDLITNAHPLQQTWAKENSVSYDLPFEKFIIQQITHFSPDILWIDDTRLLNKSWISEMKSKVTSLKLLVGHICAPFNSVIEESLSSFDIMFTCAPCTQEKFEKMGIQSHCIYHSFDHTVLDKISTIKNPFEQEKFVFTGSLYTGFGLHKSRIEYIEEMLLKGIEITIYGNLESKLKVRQKQSFYYILNTLKTFGLDNLIDKTPILKKFEKYGDEKIKYYSSNLLDSVKPPVFGVEMLQLLSISNLCFNIHGEIAKKCAGNVRLFEATGVGSCLVTDWKDNMADIFKLDEEVVTYKSINECVDKLSWLMNNPNEAKKIALAGQKRTLKDHTVENRVSEIHDLFLKLL